MKADIKGKWALVTGASRGIGREITRALGQLGCNLVLHSRAVEHTKPLAAELSANGVDVVSLQADLSDPAQVDRFLFEMESASPQIDILYNNAAVMMPYQEAVWTTPAEDFRNSFETNVLSPILLSNALVPAMIERRWGRIINLTSAIQGLPQLAPYAVSKAALKKYVEDIVPALEGTGVTMNSLDPGWIRTDMGGPDAPNAIESVLPGALVPALLSNYVCGCEFRAQDYAGMTIDQAVAKAELAQ